MLPASKLTVPVEGLSASTGTTIFGYVDTLGYDYLSIDILLTSNSALTQIPTTFKLGDSADTNLTNATDITQFVGGGAGGWTIPTNVASNVKTLWKMNMDLSGGSYERYIFLEIIPSTALTCWAFANVFRGEIAPYDKTSANVTALVEG